MKTKFIEATSNTFNFGKFMLMRFDSEFEYRSVVDKRSLLGGRGWSTEHIWVLDLQTGEGACFRPGGLASADLQKHKVWVCPLYQPFLEWLYKQDLSDLDKLPAVIDLPDAENALWGYRRPGPEKTDPGSYRVTTGHDFTQALDETVSKLAQGSQKIHSQSGVEVRASAAVPEDEVWMTNGQGDGVRARIRK